ncbi:DNA ligase 1 isoform X1 [Halyomorpha halys]|uniref:DNA ligase 1 isoform X1 n=1 Tax=Halyomorpha halys TaxID=286706 RepID=UPI0006D4D1A0|nr:uncharacterized protein LOC106678910 isoform X1 [Halyomorpha halys]
MEGEKDQSNEPSIPKVDKQKQNEDKESIPSHESLASETAPTHILDDKTILSENDSPASQPHGEHKNDTIQEQETHAPTTSKNPTGFLESEQQLTTSAEDHSKEPKDDTPSCSPLSCISEEQKQELYEVPDDGGTSGTTDHLEHDRPTHSKALEQQEIDSHVKSDNGVVRNLNDVERSHAEIFGEMTGALCDRHDSHGHSCDEMTTSCQRKNYFITNPLFHDFLDLFENEPEPGRATEDAVEDKEVTKVEEDSSSQPSNSAADVVEHQPPQPGTSRMYADLRSQSPQDMEKEMYEFMNKIYNPSPYIQKEKIKFEKNKQKEYNEKLAMKIMEKMIWSSMSTIPSAVPQVSSGPPLDTRKLKDLTHKVDELEKRLHQIDREMRESARAKKNLLERVNELELRTLETKKTKLMKQIVSADEPSEKDIQILAQLKDLMKYQEESTKELMELERKNKIMERVLSEAERSLKAPPWFHHDSPQGAEAHAKPKPSEQTPSSCARKKIHFNNVGTVVFFDSKDAPIKVPHWNSKLIEKINIHAGDGVEWDESESQDEDLIEEKLEELRRKKEEEKLVKVPVVEEEVLSLSESSSSMEENEKKVTS